jgi:zinc transporter 5/7
MLFDNASIAVAMYAVAQARRPRNRTFTYGFGRFEVLAGFANGVFLVFVSLLIVLESIERIMEPQEMSTENLMLVSVLGLVVNIAGLVACQEAHTHAHLGGQECSVSGHSHGADQPCGDDHGSAQEAGPYHPHMTPM